jgi:site-specific DNA-methyltransferase (adenine-specific)
VIARNEIIQGDVLKVLRTLPDSSVECVVTSPPYFAVRDYHADGQLGAETSVEGWLENLRLVAAEIARVLVPWGAFWLNVADVYAQKKNDGAPPKSLLLGPERLATALLADGWLVRNRLAWVKPNPMPSSATDRLTASWEFMYLLVRQPDYFFDLDSIRARPVSRNVRPRRAVQCINNGPRPHGGSRAHGHSGLERMKRLGLVGHPLGKNPGDWWQVAGRRTRHHPATFPEELVRRPILATCPERVCLACDRPWQRARHPVRFTDGKPHPRALVPCGCDAATRPGLVLDPFMGSGTTALVARQHGRDWLGIELNPEYVNLTHERLAKAT